MNNRLTGRLLKEPGGAISFRYDESWLSWGTAFPISMSLPLREDAFKGDRVTAVFENLLPDSDELRKRIAEKVGAKGIDAYSLLFQIGRDCVGALQFLPDDDDATYDTSGIRGEPVDDAAIEKMLKTLARSPLGLGESKEFRISVAGAQEKTALLYHEGLWRRPKGTTPTTHILKTQIGTLQNGMDLSSSVENEYYCLKLMTAFGLPTAAAEMAVFGKTTALVVERFDRKWTDEGRLLRLPQEDFCQALSVPPGLKYQSLGGPGIIDGLNLLKASDNPFEDQKAFLKAQVLFWLIGATDGHAKNFSIHLGRGGRFKLTPMYDVLSAQPSLATRQVERKQMKLAMFVGERRHYRLDEIKGRHFIQTTEGAGLPGSLAKEVLEEVAQAAGTAIKTVENQLPRGFPERIHNAIKAGIAKRMEHI